MMIRNDDNKERIIIMSNLTFYNQLIHTVEEKNVYRKEPMSKHTTFRIGGEADYFIKTINIEEIQSVIALCKEQGVAYYILGNGSNLLVSDQGFRGVIIQICKEMSRIKVKGNDLVVQAGALLAKIANEALNASLSGFEFAAGIPGTLGGAIVMNAGAYGGEMRDIVENVTVLDSEGCVKEIQREDLEMGYRTSVIARKGYIVLEATIRLEQGKIEQIKAKMDELKEKRVTKQPLEYPSAGSTFKRPEGYFAGKLIDDAGLRGFQVGGAAISEKHCGFVINKEEATAADVVELMKQVSEKVYQQFGVLLEPEVKKLGEF